MPSPLGHALAGVAAAWAVDLLPGRRCWHFAASPPSALRAFFTAVGSLGAAGAVTLSAAALGASPDLDLFLFRHRAITHSIGAVALVFIVAAAVTGWVTRSVQPLALRRDRTLRLAVICAAAYGSHLLLDWLAVDRNPPHGLRVLWPLSDRWYISGLDVFPQTEMRNLLSLASLRTNVKAVSFEAAVMLPVVALVWLIHVKTVPRLSTEPAGRHHPP
ncbi:MAG: metal-dependent hydrolase [Acidobacteriota bacterium]